MRDYEGLVEDSDMSTGRMEGRLSASCCRSCSHYCNTIVEWMITGWTQVVRTVHRESPGKDTAP